MTALATDWKELPGVADAKSTQAAGIDVGSVAQWFAQKFPRLPDEFGDAVLEEPDKYGKQIVCDICQPFLAATLGEHGTPDAPTVFFPLKTDSGPTRNTKASTLKPVTRRCSYD